MTKPISRRQFIAAGAAGSAALPLTSLLAATSARPQISPDVALTNPGPGAWARWLDGHEPTVPTGVTWGMPWARGKHTETTHFSVRGSTGPLLPLQTWPLAYWPDGSLKWTAHAMSTGAGDGPFEIVAVDEPSLPAKPVSVEENATGVLVDTGVIVCQFPRTGARVIGSITRDGRVSLRDGRLVLLRQDRTSADDRGVVNYEAFESTVER